MGGLANYFILLPFYANALKFPIDAIVEMGNIVNSNIVDLNSLIFYAIIPFNVLKGIVLSVITMLIYKRISSLL
jgi:riboflavin transporter FmnP